MSIDEILEMMEELLEKAVAVPFTGKKSLIDIEKMHDLIYELRANKPKEIEQARNVVGERKAILNEAQGEANGIIKKAEERAKQLVAQQEIVRLAQSRAEEIVVNAQQKSKELGYKTNDYVDSMLGKVEELLAHELSDVKKVRIALKSGGK